MVNREYIIKLILDKYKEAVCGECYLSYLDIEAEIKGDITLIAENFTAMSFKNLNKLLEDAVYKLKKPMIRR